MSLQTKVLGAGRSGRERGVSSSWEPESHVLAVLCRGTGGTGRELARARLFGSVWLVRCIDIFFFFFFF
jgi:hypothetical protein